MTWPLCARTTLSDSRIWLNASGRSLVESPKETRLLWSVTSLTVGWMCISTVPSSLICGVTSSATPEKNGVSSTSSEVVVAVPVVVSLLHAGDEELVGARLDDGLLVVQRRHARARQHARAALRVEQLDEGVEVGGIERERERAAERVDDLPDDRDCPGSPATAAARRERIVIEAARRRALAEERGLVAFVTSAVQLMPAWKP